MPRLTFPITAEGLSVAVRVHLDSASMASLLAGGHAFPDPLTAKGLIDTGSDVTVVAPKLLQQVGIQVNRHEQTQGIGGTLEVRLCRVTLFILDPAQAELPWLVLPNLLVMEMPAALPVDVLIGMDVIRTCKLVVDGPAQRFTLDF